MGTKGLPVLVAIASMVMSSCALDRVSFAGEGCTSSASCEPGAQCVDGRCLELVDASSVDASFDAGEDASVDGGPLDGGADTGTDAGRPAHCANTTRDGDETDVDCGGSCAPCDSCETCVGAGDCASGECIEGRCKVVLTPILTASGTTIPAFVRDGAILLAHYGPGTHHSAYDPHRAQITSLSGGSTPPDGWAPDPCRESGHLDFRTVMPAGRQIRMECADEVDDPATAATATLFSAFDFGDYGTVGAAGSPGWATISALYSGFGRNGYTACGNTTTIATGGLGYCNGASADYSNHVVSYTVVSGSGAYVGCGGRGCSGPTCRTHVWVWAQPVEL